jgi:mannose-6-phosphate isomerase-like protein (cupin superfamily)
MKALDIRDFVHFSEEGAQRRTLFETGQIWSEVICIQGAQGVGPMTDADSDAVVAVLAGEVSAQVGGGRVRIGQWESVLVPAGEQLTIRNASAEPAVLLLVLAPPPGPEDDLDTEELGEDGGRDEPGD